MYKIASLLILSLLWSSASNKVKISEWRGKDRKGIFEESNLLKTWPTEGLKEIFTVEKLGAGFSSPIFSDNSFYITGEVDSMTIICCYNLNGIKQWQKTLGKEWMKTFPGSRCIPTIVDNLLYVGSGLGNLYCLNKDDGKLVWSKDLKADFNGVLPLHGYSEAPLIDGEKIFWTPGGKEFNVVALNRFSGKLIWSNKGYGEASGYNSPKLIELASRNIIVTFTSYHLLGFDTKTGTLLWSHEQDNYPVEKRLPGFGDTHCNTVLYENGSIYYCAGDGNCGVKLNLSTDGSKITEVWRNKGFDGYMGGIIKIGDYIYGTGTTKPSIFSINANTGQLTDSLRIGTGALIGADNMFYYYNQKGDLMLLSYNQGKIEKVSSFKIKKGTMEHFSHPVINNGILYQRHGNTLMAFDIRKH